MFLFLAFVFVVIIACAWVVRKCHAGEPWSNTVTRKQSPDDWKQK